MQRLTFGEKGWFLSASVGWSVHKSYLLESKSSSGYCKTEKDSFDRFSIKSILWVLLQVRPWPFLWGNTDQERMGHDGCSRCVQGTHTLLPTFYFYNVMPYEVSRFLFCEIHIFPHQTKHRICLRLPHLSYDVFLCDLKTSELIHAEAVLARCGRASALLSWPTATGQSSIRVHIHPDWNSHSISSGWDNSVIVS